MITLMDISPISEGDVREIVRILGEVAAMKPAPDAQRGFLMKELAKLIGADAWVWGVAPRLVPDKQPVYLYQQTGGFDEARLSRYLVAVEHPDSGAMTAPLASAMIEAGSQVTRLVDQIVPLERYRNSPAWPYWQAADICPILITVHPLPGHGVSCIGFYRSAAAPMFTARESRIAHIVLSEVPLLHEAGLPHQTARTTPRLPPRCRLILNHLVTGLSRAQIAGHLGLSVNTVNGYMKMIFRHFHVHSQVELISRLRQGDGGDTPDLGSGSNPSIQ
jgi:DNA-binding CsgD family transcriptional regulator